MLASISIVVLILFICDNIRHYLTSKRNGPKPGSNLLNDLLIDTVLAIELCAVSLELGVVLKHYGFWWWVMGL